ncbi:HAD-superfamily hydrolase subfamily IIA protein [Dioscorea alata]|uniref:HAD-superfamily hydrolase subfamily IIA protein n=1 Tax=Dioscorea alata TaxID=55571 RepID=A0ACB7UIP3_DIOAL|nr:HAD-superfamily hydrolase subfamily IIA protein [Dioscorea alata]
MATNGAPSSPSFEALSSRTARSLIDSVDAFLFDCDGVIWTGYKLIDGVPEVLQTLRSLAYVVGAEGILEEMNLAGYACLGGPEGGKNMELDKNLLSECDKSIGAVVVGLDKHINHHKLQYATLCIRENPDCLFIATDAAGHLLANLEQCSDYQCAGCTISSLCASTEKEPIVVGKPSSFIMDILVERFQINPAKTCMVGDRLNTDILFGQNAGCKTLLVLSGVTTLSALQDPSNEIHPNYYTSNVFNIVELLRT